MISSLMIKEQTQKVENAKGGILQQNLARCLRTVLATLRKNLWDGAHIKNVSFCDGLKEIADRNH